jgi:hypothetical protein
MNYQLKNGTLFENKNSKIVPCRTPEPEFQKLAAPPPYNPSVDRLLNFKSKF